MFVPNRSLRTLRRLKLMNAGIYLLIVLAQVGQLTWGPIQPVRSGLALSVWLLLGSLTLYVNRGALGILVSLIGFTLPYYTFLPFHYLNLPPERLPINPTPADWQRDREIIGRFLVVLGAMAVIIVGLTA